MISSSIITWTSMILRSIVVLFITPFIIKNYNISESNQWVYILSCFQLLMLFDSGFTPTLIRYFSYYSDKKIYYYIERSTKLIYSFIAILVFLSSLILMKNFIFNIYFICIFILFSINIYNGKYISQLEGSGNILTSRVIILISSIIQILVLIIGVYKKANISIICLLFFMPSLVSFILYNIVLYKKNKKIIKHRNATYKLVLITIIKESGKGAISLFCTIGSIQALTIFISSNMSIKHSTELLYVIMLIRQLTGFAQVPFYVKIPEMSKLFSLKENIKLKNEAINSYILSIALIVIISLFILLINNRTIMNVTFPNIDSYLFSLITISFLFERTFAMRQQYLAIKKIIIWHYTGPFFLIITISSLYIYHYYINFYFLVPLVIFTASVFSIIYSQYLLRKN